MFPLTHLYTAKLALGYETPQTALGSLFPDYGAYLGLGRNLCHEMGVDMYHFAAEHFPDHIDFALGAMTHGTALPGIDWYADEEYHDIRPGFCFQKAELICDEVKKCCNLPQNIAIWKTHNIIELAFDIITEKRVPGIGRSALASYRREAHEALRLLAHLTENSRPGILGDIVRHGEGAVSTRSLGMHTALRDDLAVKVCQLLYQPWVLHQYRTALPCCL